MTARNPSRDSFAAREKKTAGWAVLEEIQRSERVPETLAPERVFAAVMSAFERAVGGDPDRVERGLPHTMRKLIAGHEAHVEDLLRPLLDVHEFMRSVAEHLELDETDAQELARVVFHAVHRLMSEAEVDALAHDLPEDMRVIWREA